MKETIFVPSKELLRERLDYNPESGALTWKIRNRDSFDKDVSHKIWNSRLAGMPAFTCVNSSGYYQGSINNKLFYAHRVIWKWMTGSDPVQIDHINGDRLDNKWNNLRSVTDAGNKKNQGFRSDNRSGETGVYFLKRTGRWYSRVAKRHLGYFSSLEEAKVARDAVLLEEGYHPNHGLANKS